MAAVLKRPLPTLLMKWAVIRARCGPEASALGTRCLDPFLIMSFRLTGAFHSVGQLAAMRIPHASVATGPDGRPWDALVQPSESVRHRAAGRGTQVQRRRLLLRAGAARSGHLLHRS